MLIFDLWCIVMNALGLRLVEWGMLGRWLIGLAGGHKGVCENCDRLKTRGRSPLRRLRAQPLHCQMLGCCFHFRPLPAEWFVGWGAHLLISLSLAALLPLIWGPGFCTHPKLGPCILVGFCLTGAVTQIFVLPAVRRFKTLQVRRSAFALHSMLLAGNAVYTAAMYIIARTIVS